MTVLVPRGETFTTVDQIIEKAESYDKRTAMTLQPFNAVKFSATEVESEEDEGKLIHVHRLDFKDSSFEFSEHGLTQFLQKLGIPKTYFDKCPADMKQDMVRYWLEKKENLMYQTFDETLVGVSALSAKPMKPLVVLQALKNAIADYPKELDVDFTSTFLDPYSFQLRAVLPDTERDPLEVGDLYNYGFHVQCSEVNAAKLLIAPVTHRLVCSNGMIDGRMESKFLGGRRSVTLAQDALQLVFRDLFDWIYNADKMDTVLNALVDLKKAEIEYKRDKVKSLLKKAGTGLNASVMAQFNEAVVKELPVGMLTTSNKKIEAYELYQVFTNKAQELPYKFQTQVESNVAEMLLG